MHIYKISLSVCLFLFLAAQSARSEICLDEKLIKAIEDDKTESAISLLDKGADPNTTGKKGSALCTAISRENLEMVKALVAKGAKLHGRIGSPTETFRCSLFEDDLRIHK